MTPGTVPVTAEWAIWGTARLSGQLRLLAGSETTIGADDLSNLRPPPCPASAPGSPEIAVGGLPGRPGHYLGVILPDAATADAYGLSAEHGALWTCFRVPYREVAAGPVSYQSLSAGLRAVQLRPDAGPRVEVRLDAPLPGAPADDLLMRIAALLLTRRPVCVLGAGDVASDDRLRFLDEVTALLPYGMRSQLSVTTWAGDGPHRFRLYFGSSPGSADAHVVSWNLGGTPPIEDRVALGYLEWLTDTAQAAVTLAELTEQLSFSQPDIQRLLAGIGISTGGRPYRAAPREAAYRARSPSEDRSLPPAAFMTYARFDDKYDGGQLSMFREKLGDAVQFRTGQPFQIFQDRIGIRWGDQWQQRIDDALDTATLLIPIITPSFFSSGKCREEVERFVAREGQLGGQQLIFPVYYASTELMDDPEVRVGDDIATLLHAREYADWRKLRFEEFTSRDVRLTLDALAMRIRDALQAPGGQIPFDEAEPSAPASRLRPVARKPAAPAGSSPAGSSPAGSSSYRAAQTTFTVDQYGQGDFRSIGEAMRAASPGSVIRVQPGLYQESLLMDKPLEILGDPSKGAVTVQAFGRDVLVFAADAGRVTNLTLRQIGGGARWNSVFIQRGRLELEGCDISCDSLSGIGVVKGADPLITGNAIHDCRQAGILIYDSGRGTLHDNDIFRNALAGVEIKTDGNPTVTRNKIHDCGHAGIFVHDSGLGMVEENEIYAMPSYAVTIKTRGNPTLVRNTIHDCARAGVFIFDQGAGLLRENMIYGTGYSAVAIKEGANPVLRSNVIRNSKEAGILVSNGGLGTIEDNDIFNNELDGVQIRTDANPTLRRNRIFDNKKQPIFISQGGKATLDDNELNGADSYTEPIGHTIPWYSFRSRRSRALGRPDS